ncbi:MAG: hydantoinase/oxoprolinase family protein [Thiohalocapsa sp.]|jgi:N-methylhydantoinase A|uniref:hydantoinase/oxoprolinase family protein n=1 Tax=Thiohalocapsa sp. TaxID=2497641 RepID=UPI0025CFC1BC|nr:hydantoinase/oxoprolinase family protein [Thiohalocapsa sp.]MCG6941885.1 hydantoinase/oxoprolinase family protein [Thiohalocapsa sp.]
MAFLGIDTGGTFTDFVLWQDGVIRVHKVPSTPAAPEQAILQGVRELGLEPVGLRIVHGSTVATNAVLEGKGARTAFVTNRGFGDLLSIGRQARRALYDLQPLPATLPIPPELCLETGGRLGAEGSLLEPLTDADLAQLRADVERLGAEAAAVSLLFSYLDDAAERAVARALPPGVFVSLSSAVLPLMGEYERGIATWLNARVGPVVGGYLGRLRAGLPGARVAVMQSSGETVAAELAGDAAVRLLLSGPAGGLAGAGYVARAAGIERLLTFDMGGTSTDVALVEGAPRLTLEGRIAGLPVAVPMVDMHTIGAGGGSIARVDAGGVLQVGPESAGAAPGPVCYGRGGHEPTVTDANLVLGRLRAHAFLGGRMRLDLPAASAALARLGSRLGLAAGDAAGESDTDLAERAARGVIDIVNEHMAQALRVISVQRGIDPTGAWLCCFGGAGGLHVCALAEALGMSRALVPERAGVLSALGMLVAAPGRLLTRAWLGPLAARGDAEVDAALTALAAEGGTALAAEGIDVADLARADSLDLRYRGQSYTLNVPWNGAAATADAFRALHIARYGHGLDLPVELVNLRVRLTLPARAPVLPVLEDAAADAATVSAPERVHIPGCAERVPVLRRGALSVGAELAGPAVILDDVSTTWLAPGWRARRERWGNLLLRRAVAGG